MQAIRREAKNLAESKSASMMKAARGNPLVARAAVVGARLGRGEEGVGPDAAEASEVRWCMME